MGNFPFLRPLKWQTASLLIIIEILVISLNKHLWILLTMSYCTYIKLQQTCWLQACISLDEINSLLQTVSRVSEIKYIITFSKYTLNILK